MTTSGDSVPTRKMLTGRLARRLVLSALLLVAVAVIVLLGPRVVRRLVAEFGPVAVCPARSDSVTAGGTWTESQPTSRARSEIAGTAHDGQIYVGSGFIERWEIVTSFEVYDTATDSWHEAAPVPIQLHHTAMTAAANRVYLIGGYNDDFTPDIPFAWAYDPATDTWSSIADLPEPRAAHALAVIDDLIYVVGGNGPDPLNLMVYDPQTDTWDTSRAPMPGPARDHMGAAVVDGRLYVMGGRPAGLHLGNLEVDVLAYDPATDTWETRAPMLTPRSGFAIGVLDGKIHVAGGEDLEQFCTIRSHEVYDPATDTWATWAGLPTPRHGLASAVVNGRWYVISGAVKAGSDSQYSFSNVVEAFALDA